MRLMFDIETDGFLDVCTKVHCLVAYDLDSEELHSFADQPGYQPISAGLGLLSQATVLSGHNIKDFDLPVLVKLFDFKTDAKLEDTLVYSRLIYAHIKGLDWRYKFKGMPIKLYGRHSLASWGYRLGENKGDFGADTDWQTWSQEMQDYCEQDVMVNVKLYHKLDIHNYAQKAVELEDKFADVLQWQMQMGVPFDVERAKRLVTEVKPVMDETKAKLEQDIPPFVSYSTFIPKRDNKPKGYVKGQPIAKKSVTTFNPGSRQQIVKHLKRKYKWTPVDFTEKNNPKVDREVLEKLSDWEEVPLIMDYLDMSKLMGMLQTGKQSWMNFVKDGRIYARIIHNGAITGRCTHFNPNLAQVPAVRSFKGRESRSLFYAPEGHQMVGCDAAGLELRMLAHYLHRYDGGKYAKDILEGDIHTVNQDAAGLDTRDDAKRFIYAHNYGAGDQKLGSIVDPAASEIRQKAIGRDLRRSFESRLPAIKQLVTDVKAAVKRKGYVKGLDGRLLYPRGQHMALNTLLQGAGAVVMKQATVLLWDNADRTKAYPILNVHDEFQSLSIDSYAEELAQISEQAIADAGTELRIKMPLEGEAKIGRNWAETH